MFKCERYLTNASDQRKTTAPIKYNNQTENKCIIVVMAYYTTLYFNFIMVMNQITAFALNDLQNMLPKSGHYTEGHPVYWAW
jgi:hypothetical protein